MQSVLVDTEEWHSKTNATCFSIFADTPVFERSTQAEEPSIMEQGWTSNGYLTIKAPVSLLLTVQSWWSRVVWIKLFRTMGFFLNEGEAQQPSIPSFLFRTKPQIKLIDWCMPNRQQYGWFCLFEYWSVSAFVPKMRDPAQGSMHAKQVFYHTLVLETTVFKDTF